MHISTYFAQEYIEEKTVKNVCCAMKESILEKKKGKSFPENVSGKLVNKNDAIKSVSLSGSRYAIAIKSNKKLHCDKVLSYFCR